MLRLPASVGVERCDLNANVAGDARLSPSFAIHDVSHSLLDTYVMGYLAKEIITI